MAQYKISWWRIVGEGLWIVAMVVVAVVLNLPPGLLLAVIIGCALVVFGIEAWQARIAIQRNRERKETDRTR
jgi:MFS superfamily sulfate permease-like transporter